MNPHSCSIVIASVSEASDRVRIAFAMLSASETSLAFGIACDSGYCRCERVQERVAINEQRIPMILVLHTVDCHARPVVRAMMLKCWRCDFSRTHCALDSARPMLFCVIASKAKQSTGKKSQQKHKQSPEKARAKLWRSHSTAPLWILQSLILHCSSIIESPTTAHSGNVRAVGVTLTHALWSMGIVRAEHIQIKSVQGFGGQRGIRGTLRK